MGYLVFGFMFDWSDHRWDKALRDRLFQFAPVYVSSESMRWWLGRECFARHRCILSTQEDHVREESKDGISIGSSSDEETSEKQLIGWFDERVPPLALWIAGRDKLVNGRRLLNRFESGREPCARVVHSKIIDDYEHLDVLWALDSIEKVGSEVKQVIWDTMEKGDRQRCRPLQGVGKTVNEC